MVLPGAESYKPKGKDDGGDPKRALRIAFAKTGRLTQFIEPEDSKDSPEIRARVAVRDLMRQLGFVPEPARNSRGIDTSIPAIGLKVYNSGNGKARASFPYCCLLYTSEKPEVVAVELHPEDVADQRVGEIVLLARVAELEEVVQLSLIHI